VLSPEQLRAWEQNGALRIPRALAPETVAALPAMADGLRTLEGPGVLAHREATAHGTQICRVENFSRAVPAWRALVQGVARRAKLDH